MKKLAFQNRAKKEVSMTTTTRSVKKWAKKSLNSQKMTASNKKILKQIPFLIAQINLIIQMKKMKFCPKTETTAISLLVVKIQNTE